MAHPGYIKLKYEDFRLLQDSLQEIETRTAEENILLGKIQQICALMEQKWSLAHPSKIDTE